MKRKRRLFTMLLMTAAVIFFASCQPQTEQESTAAAEDKTNKEQAVTPIQSKGTSIWQDVRILTEEYPPLNYVDPKDNILKGTSTEVVKAAIEKLGVDVPIEVYPWARAYQTALEKENIFIYSIMRTKEREKLFKWVAPVAYENVYVFALNNRKDIEINELSDIAKYKIATVREDYTEQRLIAMGFEKNIDRCKDHTEAAKKLFSERVDIWVYPRENDQLMKFLRENALDGTRIISKYTFSKEEMPSELYIAASLKTSDELVEKFREAMPPIPTGSQ